MIQVSTFYKFFDISEDFLSAVKEKILHHGQKLNIRGLFILAPEGLNSTFCGVPDAVEKFKKELPEFLSSGELLFKDSFCDKWAFHDLKVKVRPEIVTLDRPDLKPKDKKFHLSPAEWDQALESGEALVIDTRNDYEYEVGHFKGAVNPKTEQFTEFAEYVAKADLPKDKKVLIYCTGGIRCEKALLEMHEKGFHNVYQLDGGILNYLKEKPYKNFEGECFVFDYRVAVDQNLKPTKKYRLCPHCGQPGEQKINCIQCGVNETVCQRCLDKEKQFHTCSKNCAHHFRMGHKTTKIHHDAFRRRQRLDLTEKIPTKRN